MVLAFPVRAALAVATVMAIFAGMLTLSGCGGSSSPDPSDRSAPASSRASEARKAHQPDEPGRFIAQADAICARTNRQLSVRAGKSVGILKVVPRNIATERKALSELRALTAPQSIVTAWQKVLKLRRRLTAELVELVGAARRRDTSKITTLVFSKKRSHGELLGVAQTTGFRDCAKLG
jgi:hypothetical protein